MLVGENPLFSAKRKILERAGKREMKREYYELPARVNNRTWISAYLT